MYDTNNRIKGLTCSVNPWSRKHFTKRGCLKKENEWKGDGRCLIIAKGVEFNLIKNLLL